MLRWLTAGESHGPALMAVIEGLPAGVEVTAKNVQDALARRRLGYGRGARMKFEQDEVEFLGGLRHGVSLGSPIAIRIGNSEWPKWTTVMSPDPVSAEALAAADDVNAEKELARNKPLTRPRPGHADLVGMQKYGHTDARPVLERASARETAARVALGEVAARFLEQAYGIRLVSHTVAIGTAADRTGALPTPDDVERLDADPVRAIGADASAAMVAEVDAARKDGDTLGGVVEVVAYGLPPGLGSHVHWDRKLDARLAAALMSIQAIKGVEIGDGFETARRRGSAGARRDGRRRRCDQQAHGSSWRDRGWHVDRRAAPGAGGDEADQHCPSRVGDGGRCDGRGSHRHPSAFRRLCRPGGGGRRRGDGRPRSLARPAWRSSAATRSARRPETMPRTSPDPGEPAHMVTPVNRPLVVLVGPPGSGKTTVGRALSERLGAPLHDTDAAIEEATGKLDLRHLRRRRRASLPRARADRGGAGPRARNRVWFALGGGAVMDPQTEASLVGHAVVFLDVAIADASKRIGFDRSRPLLSSTRGRRGSPMMNARRADLRARRDPTASTRRVAAR